MRTVATVLLATFVLLTPNISESRTWYITPGGTGDAPTIQAGIDSAVAGDVIELEDGTYTGDGNRDVSFLGKAIAVRSSTGNPEACVVDCQGTYSDEHRGFLFVSGELPESLLEGIAVINGNFGSSEDGGGILIYNYSSPTIRNCLITQNTAMNGGGIMCHHSTPTIQNTTIINNTAVRDGGGFYGSSHYHTSTIPVLSSNVVTENSAGDDGGGIYCEYYCNAMLIGNVIADNSGVEGGGIHIAQSVLTVENCTLSENSAELGGGIYVQLGGHVDLYSTIIWNITASISGPAIYLTLNTSCYLECCDVDLYGTDGPGSPTGDVGLFAEDPLFCGEANYPTDPYRLDIASPCAVRNSPCGELIGARPAGCSGPVPTEPTTWGRVKAMYR